MEYHGEGTFKGTGGINLYYQYWYPADEIRAVLIIVPGIGGHSGLYAHVVEQLIPRHYAIYSFDMRGNGRSPGQRGFINSWSEFRDDLRAFLQLVQDQQPGCPVFLMGHSVGGVVAIDCVLHSPPEASGIRGVIAFSPALGKVGVSPAKKLLGRLLSRVLPRFSLHTGIDPKTASRDPAVWEINMQDSLRHDLVSARLGTEFFDTLEWVHAHASEWKLPLLILHGEDDQVALPEGGQRFFEEVHFADKERQEYPGARHEMQDEVNYQEVMADLENWLERHLRSTVLNAS